MIANSFKVAYIFNPGDGNQQNAQIAQARPAKRRKVARTTKIDASKQHVPQPESAFTPLFNGAESHDVVRLRKELFETAWPVLEARIQVGCTLPTNIPRCT